MLWYCVFCVSVLVSVGVSVSVSVMIRVSVCEVRIRYVSCLHKCVSLLLSSFVSRQGNHVPVFACACVEVCFCLCASVCVCVCM